MFAKLVCFFALVGAVAAISGSLTYDASNELKTTIGDNAACNCCGADYSLVCECVKNTPSPSPKPTPTPGPGPTPTPTSLTQTEKEWLDGHNSRRAKYGVPTALEWHPMLAASAKAKAAQLATSCSLQHGNPKGYGENLAAGKLAPNDVLKMWVENEESTHGGHFTQVLWRMSKWLGCAQSKCSSGSYGVIHVCHYVRPGNCNGSDYMGTSSPCTPFEP